MTNEEAIKELQAMRNCLEPIRIQFGSDWAKDEALRMAIDLFGKERDDMSSPLYRSKYWSVTEWDCLKRSRNEYAWDEDGRLCTNNEKTANLFKILDLLREWNLNWVINSTKDGYKSGYRTIEVNLAVGGTAGSYHTRGCAADIHIAGQDDTAKALADTVRVAAEAWGLEDQFGIGLYGDWIHVDTRGYNSEW